MITVEEEEKFPLSAPAAGGVPPEAPTAPPGWGWWKRGCSWRSRWYRNGAGALRVGTHCTSAPLLAARSA